MAISREIRPLSVLYPLLPPHRLFFLDWYNIKGRKWRRHEYTAPGDYWEPFKAIFFIGEVYNAARGVIFTRHYQYFFKTRCKTNKRSFTESVCDIKDLSSLEFERIFGIIPSYKGLNLINWGLDGMTNSTFCTQLLFLSNVI